MKDCAANRVKAIDDEILIKESGKLRFLVQLMARLKQEGHRTLIFSLSRKMLDIIQKVSGIQAVVRLGLVCVALGSSTCVSAFSCIRLSPQDVFLKIEAIPNQYFQCIFWHSSYMYMYVKNLDDHE